MNPITKSSSQPIINTSTNQHAAINIAVNLTTQNIANDTFEISKSSSSGSKLLSRVISVGEWLYGDAYEKEVPKQLAEIAKKVGSEHLGNALDSILDVNAENIFSMAKVWITDPDLQILLKKQKWMTDIIKVNMYQILGNLLEKKTTKVDHSDIFRLVQRIFGIIGPDILNRFKDLSKIESSVEVEKKLNKLAEEAIIAILRVGLKLPEKGELSPAQIIDGLKLPLSGWFKGRKEKLWDMQILPALKKAVFYVYDSMRTSKDFIESNEQLALIPAKYKSLIDNCSQKFISYTIQGFFHYIETSGFEIAEQIASVLKHPPNLNEQWLAKEMQSLANKNGPNVEQIKGLMESFGTQFLKIILAKNFQRPLKTIIHNILCIFDEASLECIEEDLLALKGSYSIRDDIKTLRKKIREIKLEKYYPAEKRLWADEHLLHTSQSEQIAINNRLAEINKQITELNDLHIVSELQDLHIALSQMIIDETEKVKKLKPSIINQKNELAELHKELDHSKKHLEKQELKLKQIYSRWTSKGKNQEASIHHVIQRILNELQISIDDLPPSLIARDFIWNLLTTQVMPPLFLEFIGDIFQPVVNGMEYRKELEKKLGSRVAEHEISKWITWLTQSLRTNGTLYKVLASSIEAYLPSPGLPKGTNITKILTEIFQERNPALDRVWEFSGAVAESLLLKIFDKSIKDLNHTAELELVRTEGILVHAFTPFISLVKGTLQSINDDDLNKIEEFGRLIKKRNLKQKIDEKRYKSLKRSLLPKMGDFVAAIVHRTGLTEGDLPLPSYADFNQTVWKKCLDKFVPEILLKKYDNMIPTLKDLLGEPKGKEGTYEAKLNNVCESVFPGLFSKFVAQLAENNINQFLPENIQNLLTKFDRVSSGTVHQAKDNFLTDYIDVILKRCLLHFFESLNKKEHQNPVADVEIVTSVINSFSKHFEAYNRNDPASIVSEFETQTKLLQLVGLNSFKDLKSLPIPADEGVWNLIQYQVFPLLFNLLRQQINDPSFIENLFANLLETINEFFRFKPLEAFKNLKLKRGLFLELQNNPQSWALAEKYALESDQEERLLIQFFQRLSYHGSSKAQDILDQLKFYSTNYQDEKRGIIEDVLLTKISQFDFFVPETIEPNPKEPAQYSLNVAMGKLFNQLFNFLDLERLNKQHPRLIKPILNKLQKNPEWLGSFFRIGMNEHFFTQLINQAIEMGLPAIYENGTYRWHKGKVISFVDKVSGGPVSLRTFTPKENDAYAFYEKAVEAADKENKEALKKARSEYINGLVGESKYTKMVNHASKVYDYAIKTAEANRNASLTQANIETNKVHIQKIHTDSIERINEALKVMPSLITSYYINLKWAEFHSRVNKRIKSLYFGNILYKLKIVVDKIARFIFITIIGQALLFLVRPLVRFIEKRVQVKLNKEMEMVTGRVKQWWLTQANGVESGDNVSVTSVAKISNAEALIRDIVVTFAEKVT